MAGPSAALQAFVAAVPGVQEAAVSNSFGLLVASATAPSAVGPSQLSALAPIAFTTCADLMDKLGGSGCTLLTATARFERAHVVYAALFPPRRHCYCRC